MHKLLLITMKTTITLSPACGSLSKSDLQDLKYNSVWNYWSNKQINQKIKNYHINSQYYHKTANSKEPVVFSVSIVNKCTNRINFLLVPDSINHVNKQSSTARVYLQQWLSQLVDHYVKVKDWIIIDRTLGTVFSSEEQFNKQQEKTDCLNKTCKKCCLYSSSTLTFLILT